MPYPRTEPASEREMFAGEHPGHHTICQTLREIHREIPQDDEELKRKVRLVWAFAKKMHNRLKEYRKRYDDEQVEFTEET